MIKADPRPPRGGRLFTEAKNCFSVSIRASSREGATENMNHIEKILSIVPRSNFGSDDRKKQSD